MSTSLPVELRENLQEFCKNRASIYGLLARSYEKEIDADLANRIANDFELDSADKELGDEALALKSSLKDISEEELEQLAVVFNRTFFGMGPQMSQKAFPYASVYTSSEGLMLQEEYVEISKIYIKEGYAKNPTFAEPEDHIAVELAFMQALATKVQGMLENSEVSEDEVIGELRKQESFLREHFLNWINLFVQDMKTAAESGFYWHLARFTKLFLEGDLRALEEVLDVSE